jgi:hypothetical protein
MATRGNFRRSHRLCVTVHLPFPFTLDLSLITIAWQAPVSCARTPAWRFRPGASHLTARRYANGRAPEEVSGLGMPSHAAAPCIRPRPWTGRQPTLRSQALFRHHAPARGHYVGLRPSHPIFSYVMERVQGGYMDVESLTIYFAITVPASSTWSYQ